MNNKNFIAGILLICGLIIGGAFLYVFMSSRNPAPQPTSTEVTSPTPAPVVVSTAIPSPPVFSGKQVINLTKDGFSPATIKVKSGTLVQWINQSGVEATVNSADHPTHQVYTPLNLGKFPNGSSLSLIFDKAGTFKYHNHLNSVQTGTVIVE